MFKALATVKTFCGFQPCNLIEVKRFELFVQPFEFRVNIVLPNGISCQKLAVPFAAGLLFLLSLIAGALLNSIHAHKFF